MGMWRMRCRSLIGTGGLYAGSPRRETSRSSHLFRPVYMLLPHSVMHACPLVTSREQLPRHAADLCRGICGLSGGHIYPPRTAFARDSSDAPAVKNPSARSQRLHSAYGVISARKATSDHAHRPGSWTTSVQASPADCRPSPAQPSRWAGYNRLGTGGALGRMAGYARL